MAFQPFAQSELGKLFEADVALVTWLSFEDRSVAALTQVLATGRRSDVFVFRFKEAEYALSEIVRSTRLSAKSIIKGESELQRSDQYEIVDTLRTRIGELIPNYRRVYIDISCFPREAVLMLTYVLSRLQDISNVSLLYNIAKDYSFNEEDHAKKWLGKGLKKVAPVIGFSGRMIPGRPLALIGLVGMDEERYVRMVEALEPSVLHTGIAQSPSPNWKWLTANAVTIAEKISGKIPTATTFEYDCNSIGATIKAIESVYDRLDAMNVCLITLNNKVSTLAAGLFSLKRREVQICSAPALVYNYSGYSIPSDRYFTIAASDLFGTEVII